MTTPDDLTLGDLLPILDEALCRQESASTELLQNGLEPSVLYQDASDRLAASCSQSPYQGEWGCGRGCGACCHQTIPVTPVEALQLADYVREQYSEEEQQVIKQRIRANADKYGQLPPSEYRSVRLRCAFLDDSGSCGVHPSRPLRCRGFHSLSRASCEAVHQGRQEVIPVDPHTNSSMRGAQSGLSGALRRQGLDGDYYELHAAVLCALETTAGERWRRGEDVFANCSKTVAVPDDVWIAPQEDGSVVKLHRIEETPGNVALEAVVLSERQSAASNRRVDPPLPEPSGGEGPHYLDGRPTEERPHPHSHAAT